MRRTPYRKLIRDRIPEILSERGVYVRVRRLSPARYMSALKVKTLEESRELCAARGNKAVLNELADLQELIDALRRSCGVSPKRFRDLVARKRKARGGFHRKLFLEYTEEP